MQIGNDEYLLTTHVSERRRDLWLERRVVFYGERRRDQLRVAIKLRFESVYPLSIKESAD
jgi:hypothetical protein